MNLIPSWFGPLLTPPDPEFSVTQPPTKAATGIAGRMQEMERVAERFELPKEDEAWFDMWHTHPDGDGYGNSSLEHRLRVIRAGLITLRRAARSAEGWPRPIQVWMIIDPYDSAQDAVYAHTPNPNRELFPYPFDVVDWTAECPPLLDGVLQADLHQIGRSDDDWTMFWVRFRSAT
jgi:hypothetical protein